MESRTGQTLTEGRMWRVPSALAGVFRERGISNVDQLVCLLDDPTEHRLAGDVVEALLNHETYFFRDQASFAALQHEVLPELARTNGASRQITVWCAGCSTGQEALSLAMLFAEHPARWRDWRITIVGTDISAKAIAAARTGVYSQFEIQRGISVSQMLEYFSESASGWQASERIRSLVRFQQHNLLDCPPLPARFDLILCRNVLLYFDPATRSRAFARLHSAINPDGWLMLGAGETVVGQTDQFSSASRGVALFRSDKCKSHDPGIAGSHPSGQADCHPTVLRARA
ncbi:MAG: protein-glutamate O-methyltransferase CheR [Sphingomonadaceae bacterium]